NSNNDSNNSNVIKTKAKISNNRPTLRFRVYSERLSDNVDSTPLRFSDSWSSISNSIYNGSRSSNSNRKKRRSRTTNKKYSSRSLSNIGRPCVDSSSNSSNNDNTRKRWWSKLVQIGVPVAVLSTIPKNVFANSWLENESKPIEEDKIDFSNPIEFFKYIGELARNLKDTTDN